MSHVAREAANGTVRLSKDKGRDSAAVAAKDDTPATLSNPRQLPAAAKTFPPKVRSPCDEKKASIAVDAAIEPTKHAKDPIQD